MISQHQIDAAMCAHAQHGAMELEDGLHSCAADAACAMAHQPPSAPAAGAAAATAAMPPTEPQPEQVHMWDPERLHPGMAVLLYGGAILGGLVLSHLAAIGW